MPLTKKGKKILGSMRESYGSDKGKQVFYASKNKGIIGGVDKKWIKGRPSTVKRGSKYVKKGGKV
jgi:hypothetical protein